MVTIAMPSSYSSYLTGLYAQLHINIIHPCKYEEISLSNKGVIRTIFFGKNVVTMAT